MADTVNGSAGRLSDTAQAAGWTGNAAEGFRATAENRAQAIRKCAKALDDAAAAVKTLSAVVG
jgi:uncharacterized protein YukE